MQWLMVRINEQSYIVLHYQLFIVSSLSGGTSAMDTSPVIGGAVCEAILLLIIIIVFSIMVCFVS